MILISMKYHLSRRQVTTIKNFFTMVYTQASAMKYIGSLFHYTWIAGRSIKSLIYGKPINKVKQLLPASLAPKNRLMLFCLSSLSSSSTSSIFLFAGFELAFSSAMLVYGLFKVFFHQRSLP